MFSVFEGQCGSTHWIGPLVITSDLISNSILFFYLLAFLKCDGNSQSVHCVRGFLFPDSKGVLTSFPITLSCSSERFLELFFCAASCASAPALMPCSWEAAVASMVERWCVCCHFVVPLHLPLLLCFSDLMYISSQWVTGWLLLIVREFCCLTV